MGPPTRGERGKKVAVGPKVTLTKASNAQRASKAGMVAAELHRALVESMTPFGGGFSDITLPHSMRQLNGLQYAVTPPTFCWPLRRMHTIRLRPRDVVGEILTKRLALAGSTVGVRSWLLIKLAQLLGRSILARLMKPQSPADIMKQCLSSSSSSSSSYEMMVTAIMNELSSPLSKEEAVLQQFQNMSLEKPSDVDDGKVVDEVDGLLGEAMAVKGGDDLVSALVKRLEQLDKLERALARSGMVPDSLRQSLHPILAEEENGLVPCPCDVSEIRTEQSAGAGSVVPDGARLLLRDKVLRLLGPSIYKVIRDLEMDILAREMMMTPPPSLEKQEWSSSAFKDLVTAIDHKPDLPPILRSPNYGDLVRQSFQSMSLLEQ